jgi:enhancer of mRNA-decapping protein 4
VVRSQAQTPAPSVYEVQENIKQMLVQNQINRAFHTALLANDLHLVEFTLEKADYSKVFNPCPLEQTVLLSLVQQISADMSNYNDLKHK